MVQRITQQVDEMTVKMFGEKKTQAKKPQAENQDEAAAEAAEWFYNHRISFLG